jgi:hypothetical protein
MFFKRVQADIMLEDTQTGRKVREFISIIFHK